MGDDDKNPGETGRSTKATSVESKMGPATLQGPRPREQADTHGCLSTHTTEATAEPIDCSTSPSAPLHQHPCGRFVGEDDSGAGVVASPPSPITPPLSPQSQAQNTALEEQEWEITKIVSKRRAGKGFEYKVHWKNTWLPKSELGNARRLLQEFEAQYRAQPGPKPHRPTRAGKGARDLGRLGL